ncbi:MAG TPA: PDZ domain-containing protein, partial [Anaerolineales bacterium]|nr:PDZ domain-containing protein [Anaerolineales bacterium]
MMIPSNRFNTVVGTVTQSLVLFYQAVAVLVFTASLFSAYAWLKNPFIGGFFEQTMVLNESVTREPGQQWALQEKGFRLGDRLTTVGGQPIASAEDLRKVLEYFRVGDRVHVVMHSPDGELKEADIKLQSLSTVDQISYYVIPAFLSLVFLVISLWIFGLRRTEPAGRT